MGTILLKEDTNILLRKATSKFLVEEPGKKATQNNVVNKALSKYLEDH